MKVFVATAAVCLWFMSASNASAGLATYNEVAGDLSAVGYKDLGTLLPGDVLRVTGQVTSVFDNFDSFSFLLPVASTFSIEITALTTSSRFVSLLSVGTLRNAAGFFVPAGAGFAFRDGTQGYAGLTEGPGRFGFTLAPLGIGQVSYTVDIKVAPKPVPTPEPGMLALLGSAGLVGGAAAFRKRLARRTTVAA